MCNCCMWPMFACTRTNALLSVIVCMHTNRNQMHRPGKKEGFVACAKFISRNPNAKIFKWSKIFCVVG